MYNDGGILEFRQELIRRHTTRLNQYRLDGRKDGEMNLPLIDDERVSETEIAILNDYSADLSNLITIGRPLLDAPHQEHNKLEEELKTISNNLPQIQGNKKAEADNIKKIKTEDVKKNLESSIENILDEKKRSILEWQDAQTKFSEVTSRIGREEPIIYIKSSKVAWSILIFLGLCEIPLNYAVFANFLLPNIETYILAALLVVAVPIISHHSGICLKQYEETPKFFTYFWIEALFMIILSIAVGVLRTNYAKELSEESLSNNWETITFILISILLYIVGVIISYLHHDKSQELVTEHKKYLDSKAKYETKIKPLEDKERKEKNNALALIKDIDKEYNESIEYANRIEELMNEKISNNISKHDEVLNALKGLEKEISSNYKACISTYRSENHRSRTNGKRPLSWNKIYPLELYFINIEELDVN